MPIYNREKLLRRDEFAGDKDVIMLTVRPDELITIEEARDRIGKFRNTEVK